jgi:O-methyltransferase
MLKFLAKVANYILGKKLRKNKIFVTSSLEYLHRDRKIDHNYFDYIRLATLELVVDEIQRKNLIGNVAELGVYKGKFARYINSYFPSRTLYLFDTFEGFDDRDVITEKKQEYSEGNQDFSDTSLAKVLQQMPYPNKCQPVKGFFPESAKGLEDSFVFVSIDADLYEPIYAGLEYFYPRLVKGGYIFVHDVNNENYNGSRKAIEQFCREQSISFIPIPDSGGSGVIVK